ncbi:MAG: hypothetical protein WBP12_03595 [Candidatus Saccharimonas sp.]
MINLLSPQDRKELAAARTNTLLLRYVTLLGMFIGILVLEIGAVYVLISNDKARNEAVIAENALKTAEYEPTRQQAASFRTNLATAKYILDKQVPYTELILILANNLPEGSVFDSIALNPTTFGTPTSLNVRTTSYQKSIDVKNALQAIKIGDKPLFSSVAFSSVTRSEDDKDKDYPYTTAYTVAYTKDILK